MAQNRQISKDFRDIDLTGGDYSSEAGEGVFLVYSGTGGAISFRCPETGLKVVFDDVSPDKEMPYYTDLVYQSGTSATNLKAIYD